MNDDFTRRKFLRGVTQGLLAGAILTAGESGGVYGEKGWIGMDPAFSYTNLQAESSKAEGPVEERSRLSVQPKDQFALEMDHFGECVQEDKLPYTGGEEGLQDQRLMETIYEAARSGQTVRLNSSAQLDQFRGSNPQG